MTPDRAIEKDGMRRVKGDSLFIAYENIHTMFVMWCQRGEGEQRRGEIERQTGEIERRRR